MIRGAKRLLEVRRTILADRQGIVRKKVIGFEETKVFETALAELFPENSGKR